MGRLVAMSKDELVQQIRERYRQEGREFNEAQRRWWAAQAVQQLGRGGMAAVTVALRISPNTIKRGLCELKEGVSHALTNVDQRIRRPGGGRKSPVRESSATAPGEAPDETPKAPGDVLID